MIMKSKYQDKKVWDSHWQQTEYTDLPIDFEVVKVLSKHINRDDKMIEIGCGTGAMSTEVALRKKAKLYFFDYSTDALELAEKYAIKKGISTQKIKGDAKKIPIKSNSFDVVWNEGVVEHFRGNERQKVIDEMIRICKPNGKVIIFVPNSNCWPYRVNKFFRELFGLWKWGYEEPYTMNELLMRTKLLNIIEKGYLNYLDAMFNWPILYRIFRFFKKTFRINDSKLPLILGISGLQLYIVGKKK